MGYVFAIITSLFFTAYVVPKKLSDQTPIRYSLFQGIGFFIAAGIAYIISRISADNNTDTINDPVLLLSILTGVVWFAGSMFLLMAIDKLGLSRSNQWKNLQGPFGAVFNMIFLAEYLTTNVLFLVIASAFILISAVLFNIRNPEEIVSSKTGIVFALLAAVFFGLNSMLQNYVTGTGHSYSQLLCISFSVMVSSAVYLLIKEKSLSCVKEFYIKKNIMGFLAGILYFFAAFFATQAYKRIPGSVAFTIIQLNAVWTILAGILIFKEINFKKHWLRICCGILFAVAGVVMLLYAKK